MIVIVFVYENNIEPTQHLNDKYIDKTNSKEVTKVFRMRIEIQKSI